MKTLVIAVMALALAGCQTVTPEKVDATIDSTLPIVCAGVDVAWLAYAAADMDVKPALDAKLKAAYVAAKGVCLNPPANSTEALLAATKAYMDFKTALKAAKNGVGS